MACSFNTTPPKLRPICAQHGVPFADAEGVLGDPLAITVEDPDAESEARFIAVGLGSAGAILVVIYTERGGEYRLISARRATRRDRRAYEG